MILLEDVWSEIRGWWGSEAKRPKQTGRSVPEKMDCTALHWKEDGSISMERRGGKERRVSGSRLPSVPSVQPRIIRRRRDCCVTIRSNTYSTVHTQVAVVLRRVLPRRQSESCSWSPASFLEGCLLPSFLGCGTGRSFTGLKEQKV
jgi:hypothetical protein